MSFSFWVDLHPLIVHLPIGFLIMTLGIDGIVCVLDHLAQLHEAQYRHTLNDEVLSRVSQYEMAYRMQTSVPATLDVSKEPDYIYDRYGEESRKLGTFAIVCWPKRTFGLFNSTIRGEISTVTCQAIFEQWRNRSISPRLR